MVQYDKKIMNQLLDSYEKSLLFTGENKVNISIQFAFNRKNIPAYFDESSSEYEVIHVAMKNLQDMGYVRLVWKKGKENHILSKVLLNVEKLEQAYAYVNRTKKADYQMQMTEFLKDAVLKYNTPVCTSFLLYVLKRIENNQSVKEYIDIKNIRETEALIKGIHKIEMNQKECYVREFSITVFQDSKYFEQISSKVAKVFKTFHSEFGAKSTQAILAEYGIYNTPNYVYFKGAVSLGIDDNWFPIGSLRQGIGISGDDIGNLKLKDFSEIKNVMTIENLTTFFRWNEPGSLIIYLGGYHNSVRRTLLKAIYEYLPTANYYHFGDIDAGGFEIYRDLCEKTGIPFEMYHMDLDTLVKYQKYGKALTENDRIRLEKLRNGAMVKESELIQYMLEHNVKLEQECIVREEL